MDERTVRDQRPLRQAEEVHSLAEVNFHSVAVGTGSVLETIDQVRAARHGVGPFNRAVEVLVEGSHRNLFVFRGVELVAQVQVVHVARFQVGVALHGTCQVEVVVDTRAHLAEFCTVDGAAVAGSQLLARRERVGKVERWEETIGIVEVGKRTALVVARVAHEFHAAALEADTTIHLQGTEGEKG